MFDSALSLIALPCNAKLAKFKETFIINQSKFLLCITHNNDRNISSWLRCRFLQASKCRKQTLAIHKVCLQLASC